VSAWKASLNTAALLFSLSQRKIVGRPKKKEHEEEDKLERRL
jgi:hypothetical protein